MKAVVLGEHTAISLLQREKKYEKIRYLRENGGKVPSQILCVGDRRRVWSTLELLEKPVLIDQAAARKFGASFAGRVAVGVGIRRHKGEKVPITVLETQMGCSAQDINAWEIMANTATEYRVGRKSREYNKISVLRAGTCGGIIEKPTDMKIGDIAIATKSIADGATSRQRLGVISPFGKDTLEKFKERWIELGGSFTLDGTFPQINATEQMIAAIRKIGRGNLLEGANFTKESLYAESDEEETRGLRTKYGVITTEMEHFGLATIARKFERDANVKVLNGLISTVVGTIPGGSFAEAGSKEERFASKRIGIMLEIALDSLCACALEG